MTEQAKHTPGPWKILRSRTDVARGVSITMSDGSGARVAVSDDGWPNATQDANARLIASAPEMLAALKNICLTYEAERKHNGRAGDPSDSLEDARAAIARAEGR